MKTDELKCDRPDCEAVPKIERNIQGVYCAKCDKWIVVATYIPEILSDVKEYRMILAGGDFKNTNHIKTVANIFNVNFIDARNILKEDGAKILVGSANKIKISAQKLAQAGIIYRIEPEFPYSIDENEF